MLNLDLSTSFFRNEVIENGEVPGLYPNQQGIGKPGYGMWGLRSEGFFYDEADIASHDPQAFGSVWDLDAHQALHGSGVAPAVAEAADPADPLHDVYHVVVVPLLGQLLQSAVDVPYGGDGAHDGLVLELQVQMDRFGEGGVLWAERDDRSLSHQDSSFGAALGPFHGAFLLMRKKLPL